MWLLQEKVENVVAGFEKEIKDIHNPSTFLRDLIEKLAASNQRPKGDFLIIISMKSLINEYLIFSSYLELPNDLGNILGEKWFESPDILRHDIYQLHTMIFTIHDTKLTVKHQEYKLFSFFLRLNARYVKARKETGYDDHFRVDEGISTTKNSPISPPKRASKLDSDADIIWPSGQMLRNRLNTRYCILDG